MRQALLASAVVALVGCDSPWECVIPDGSRVPSAQVIGCQRDRDVLSDDRQDSVFAHTSTLNWLIDREDHDRVYFIDSNEFRLHYYFASAFLDDPDKTPVGSHAEFNILNYRRDNRRFILGKLMQYHDQDLLTIELTAGDTAGPDMIVDAYELIAASLFDGGRLRYRPVSAAQEALLPELASRIDVISTAQVFANQVYQPLNQQTGYGTLRFARVTELAAHPVLPTEIVVLDRVPNDIAMVSGIVTEEFQTPLAHINILSKNRGTPNMGLRDAFTDPTLRALEGQLVRLDVTPQQFTVAQASPEDAERYWDELRPPEALVPIFDLSVAGLQPLAELDLSDSISVGTKAASMAELGRIDTAPIPLPDQPFAVPFLYYQAHVETAGIAQLIDEVLADAPSLSPSMLQERLFEIRWAIFQAPLDAQLAADLAAAIAARWGEERSVRFRSSSNAEDLLEFSGAGLYTSASGRLSDGPDTVTSALKVVWASAWTYQAFVERSFYRVDHGAVKMAALVHPAFEDEAANGVAITINEFNERRPAFYINAQVSDISVTNPTGIAMPEQLLYYLYYEEPEYEVISRSTLTDGPVLFDAELDELAASLEAIHNHFRAAYAGGANFAVDVEFKLDAQRHVIIKQARPIKSR